MSESLAVITGTFAHANAIKTRSTFQLIIEIPIEGADAALSRLGGWPQPGKEKPVAIALLNPNRTLADGPHALNLKAKGPATLAQIAGILCAESEFQSFLGHTYQHIEVPFFPSNKRAEWAAAKLRAITGVDSRKEFDTDNRAAHRFLMLKEAFEQWNLP